ncbi:MAG: alpha/beta hydrolase [Acidobacteria bacterium]|nr:alpha/beta hydrolase [Acidobacteriota bacterium]
MDDLDDATPAAWFTRALEVPSEQRSVTVNGALINYMDWGPHDAPGLVFVHGGAAHLHWWSFLAPLFADQYRVAALDLSGHGRSGRREQYALEGWTDEIVAVAEELELPGPPVVIGHSMGGFITLATAGLHPDAVAGIVVIDSPVLREDPESEEARQGNSFRPPKVYKTAEEMVSRFRTVPEQEHYVSFIMDHVARHSIVEVEGGYTWAFDPRVFSPWRNVVDDLLTTVKCRVALFGAEYGLLTHDIGEYMYERLGRVAPVVEIPEAGHHIMLDQPLSLLTGLRTLLADWEHSVPIAARH